MKKRERNELRNHNTRSEKKVHREIRENEIEGKRERAKGIETNLEIKITDQINRN